MMHLLPIRPFIATITILVVLALLVQGIVPYGGWEKLLLDIRWLSLLVISIPIILCAFWRWYSKFRTFIFPYLGGQWTGSIEFQGSHGCGTRNVSLRINHTLFTIKLLLESEESTSRTLSVCANRDPGINRNLLYYVFQNERKEGIPNEKTNYRGLAVLRLDAENSRLLGDYFTEQKGSGQLIFERQKEHAWWYPLR